MKSVFAFFFLIAVHGYATSREPISLDELVRRSDHIVVARVFKVDMVDGAGRQVTDEAAMTGPGEDKTIRLHVEVDQKRVLKSKGQKIPDKLILPLLNLFHYRFGDVAAAHKDGEQYTVFFLKGNKFAPAQEDNLSVLLAKIDQVKRIIAQEAKR